MSSFVVHRGRCAMLGAFAVSAVVALAFALGVPVAGQTKPATPKTGKPLNKPVNKPVGKGDAKAANASPAIPGFSPIMPAGVREGIERQLRGPLNDRTSRRREADKTATAWLQRASSETDGEIQAAALMVAGALQTDALKLAEAVKTFDRVTVEHSSNVWAIEARLFLCDLALEHELNLTRAEEWLGPATQWLKTVPAPAAAAAPKTGVSLTVPQPGPNDPLSLESPGPNVFPALRSGARQSPGSAGRRESPEESAASSTSVAPQEPELAARDAAIISADVRLRMGLFHALRGNAARAKVEFLLANGLGFDPTTALAAAANRSLTNQRQLTLSDPVTSGPAETVALIRLAVLIGDSLQPDRALRLWDALLKLPTGSKPPATDNNKPPVVVSDPQRSFAHFQRGFARFRMTNPLERDFKLIVRDYEQSVKLAPQSYWADDALVLHANLEWNTFQNGDKAVPLWTRVLDQHPGSEHGPRAAYFIGVAHENAKQWDRAKTAYDDAKQRFPDSPFNRLIDSHLKKVQSELARPKPAGK